MNHYLVMFIAGFIGVILHALIKIRGINRNLSSETYGSVFVAYWKMDWISLTTSIVVVFAAMFLSSEYLSMTDKDPIPGNITEMIQYKLASFIKTTFVVVGYCADSIVYAYLGTTEKKLKDKAKDGGADVG